MKIWHKIEDGKIVHEIPELAKEKKTGKIEISKPETDEKNHRIPVKECKITATIDISPEEGITALYCGKEKEIATYLFDVDKFTMKEAKAWVKEHLKDKGKGEKSQALSFGFKKIDKEEHIVGGIIYEPDKEDTQGDQANAKEIWKALKNYMIKGRSIKVMHKGKAKSVPIIECFQAEENTHKGGTGPEHLVKKGAWWLSVYLGGEPEIWKDVLAGKLNGFSMAGRAEAST